MAPSKKSGSIAIAFNGAASAALDIPKPTGRDSLIAVAVKGDTAPTSKVGDLLPTPPNSISPSLPPHGLKARGGSAVAIPTLDSIESDVDLQDDLTGSPHSQRGYDTAGVISPALLAKHHLPEILLSNGPLAIRHIMGYLTTSVPGFSSIPPAKARRLVVGALEGRGSGGDGGGIDGDVKFEKVGWGRWDARSRGQPARSGRGMEHSPPPSAPSSFSPGMPISSRNGRPDGHLRTNGQSSSWAGDSGVFSHDDDMDITMMENEADKMSLDGSCSSSEAPPEDEIMGDDPNDMTDDEDWASLGAAALRQAAYSASGPGRSLMSSHVYTGGSYRGGGPSISALAKSAPMNQAHNFKFSTLGTASDSQEREAVEALLQLGSL